MSTFDPTTFFENPEVGRLIPLTQGYWTIVDEEDFLKLMEHKWCVSVYGYAVRKQKGEKRIIWMHRVINNTPQDLETDHINRNRLDNRKSNLRTCTTRENQLNKGISKRNTSGVNGVCWYKRDKRWVARVWVKRKTIKLGYFHTLEEAKKARLQGEKQYYAF